MLICAVQVWDWGTYVDVSMPNLSKLVTYVPLFFFVVCTQDSCGLFMLVCVARAVVDFTFFFLDIRRTFHSGKIIYDLCFGKVNLILHTSTRLICQTLRCCNRQGKLSDDVWP